MTMDDIYLDDGVGEKKFESGFKKCRTCGARAQVDEMEMCRTCWLAEEAALESLLHQLDDQFQESEDK
jgi:ribosomal protein S14